MSQSDLNIANVSRSLFRQEANEALQALGSLSSGATEPTTTYAYQLWADTASGLLKQRTAANDGWISKGNLADVDWGLLNKAGGTMTGLLNLAAGTDIASATTVDLTAATGNSPKITGTTDIEVWTMNTGQQMKCIAGGAFKLVYDATTNNVEGGADYTCAAGDIINLVKGLDGVIQVRIEKQDGTPVISPSGVPTGTILDFGGASAPTGFLLCDGSNANRTTYAALFTAIGTAFGVGDGSTTFGLPDFRRRVAVGSGGTGTGTLGNAVGDLGGAEEHTLITAEMPSHTHTQNAHGHTQRAGSSVGGTTSGQSFAASSANGVTTSTSTLNATATNQDTGGDGAHNNMQPSLVVTKIIKT